MSHHKIARILLAAAAILVMSFGAATAEQDPPEPQPLFSPPTEAMSAGDHDAPSDLGVQQERLVNANLDYLLNARRGDRLTLNLFSDADLTATITEFSRQDDAMFWVAQIDEAPLGQAFFVAHGGQMIADISTPQGLYQVRFAGGDRYAVRQIDQAQYPEELPPIEVASAENGAADSAAPQAPQVTADDGSVIDVLVLYTPAARIAQGGTTAIRNLIDLAVLETNQSYINSGVNQRLYLSYVSEIAYTEAASMYTDLGLLSTGGNGLSTVASIRENSRADLVSLIVESSQYCGVAYHMATVSHSFQSAAFSVVARTCATGYFSFGHEMGHNMGARHDWYVDEGVTPHSYSHGYVNPAARWRTIMAYDYECFYRGFNCTRLPYWSNPALTYGGQPLGVWPGTYTGCNSNDLNHPPCDADDHRTLNETAYTVANFRQRMVTHYWDYGSKWIFMPLLRR